MTNTDIPGLILASGSSTRKMILENAGLDFHVRVANVDEDELKHSLKAAGASAEDTAVALAELKASRVSKEFPEFLVIGADQMLECNDIWFDKPIDMEHARAHLMAFRGKTHQLRNAICVAKSGQIIWHYSNTAHMAVRKFSDEFLDNYIENAGDEILNSVGAYQLENMGSQLFNKIDGDFFSILGLPLLPLLDFLRGHGVVQK